MVTRGGIETRDRCWTWAHLACRLPWKPSRMRWALRWKSSSAATRAARRPSWSTCRRKHQGGRQFLWWCFGRNNHFLKTCTRQSFRVHHKQFLRCRCSNYILVQSKGTVHLSAPIWHLLTTELQFFTQTASQLHREEKTGLTDIRNVSAVKNLWRRKNGGLIL